MENEQRDDERKREERQQADGHRRRRQHHLHPDVSDLFLRAADVVHPLLSVQHGHGLVQLGSGHRGQGIY